jgi:hypothetical protein
MWLFILTFLELRIYACQGWQIIYLLSFTHSYGYHVDIKLQILISSFLFTLFL